MIRYLEDGDVENILLHVKINITDITNLMGNYIGLVDIEEKKIINLCFYDPPYKIIRTYGSADNFIDFMKREDEVGV